ncbi:45426_t:CDS:1, partial [Gigaspora margarita]
SVAQFDITTKQLYEWTTKKKALQNVSAYFKQLNTSAHFKYLLLEANFKNWVKSLRLQQKIVY